MPGPADHDEDDDKTRIGQPLPPRPKPATGADPDPEAEAGGQEDDEFGGWTQFEQPISQPPPEAPAADAAKPDPEEHSRDEAEPEPETEPEPEPAAEPEPAPADDSTVPPLAQSAAEVSDPPTAMAQHAQTTAPGAVEETEATAPPGPAVPPVPPVPGDDEGPSRDSATDEAPAEDAEDASAAPHPYAADDTGVALPPAQVDDAPEMTVATPPAREGDGAPPDVLDAPPGASETDAVSEAPLAPPPPAPLPRTATTATGPAEPGARDRIVGIGTLINNNYEITEVLKSGGMGEVYRGTEIGTGDPVAIKAILPELAEDEKAGLLFKREAKTLRQLADDAIVRYYNYVHDLQLDRYFLVMEFISGVPLSDFVQQNGAIAPGAARTLLRRLSRGLSKAHARDVIHRDLSPDNVMLPDGLVGEAVLIDFGIAKSNVVKESTMAGQFAGKFKYVAPEQLGHYDGAIGPRTDIYGLALLVCAAVIGKPLNMGASIVEAVDSRRSIPDLSAVPDDLRPLLAHMLEPDPEDRPATMLEVERMTDAPEMVPEKYGGQGLDAPFGQQTDAPRSITTPGNIPAFGGATARPSGPLTQPGGQSLPPQGAQTAPPQPMVVEESGRRSGAGMLYGLMALFLLILGGAGLFAWSNGLIGGTANDEVAADPSGGTEEPAGAGIPAPDQTSREGFLAALDAGTCSFATRIGSGQNAGMIAGFSAGGGDFAGLPDAYETRFGARPEILSRDIDPQQCPVLDFARALQGRGRPDVDQQFNTDTILSGEAVTGQITAPGDENVWTVLVSSNGNLYNLTERLTDPVGGRRTLSFGLNLTEGGAPQPQLVMTVASDGPLATAAAMRDGTAAETALPAVLDEIAASGGAASVALSYLRLLPPR